MTTAAAAAATVGGTSVTTLPVQAQLL